MKTSNEKKHELDKAVVLLQEYYRNTNGSEFSYAQLQRFEKLIRELKDLVFQIKTQVV